MLHPLYKPPSIPLSFNLAAIVPRRSISRVSWNHPRFSSSFLFFFLPLKFNFFLIKNIKRKKKIKEEKPK